MTSGNHLVQPPNEAGSRLFGFFVLIYVFSSRPPWKFGVGFFFFFILDLGEKLIDLYLWKIY